MLIKPTLTEKIIRTLSATEEYFYVPSSVSKMEFWINNSYERSQKRKRAQQKRMRKRVREALNRLNKIHILSYSHDSQSFKLTPKGWLKYLYYYSLRKPHNKSKKVKKTKKKYLIIFDIPEAHRRFRDLLRKSLQNQECKMVQKSVFLCPTETTFLWAKKVVCSCELDGHVLFVEADRID